MSSRPGLPPSLQRFDDHVPAEPSAAKVWVLRGIIAAGLVALAWSAFAQNAVTQSGPVTSRAAPMFMQDRQIGVAGGLTGRLLGPFQGYGLAPFSITDKVTGVPGLGLCSNSAITGEAYNAFCFGHDSSSNALITVDSLNGLANKELKIRINGTTYSWPGVGVGNILGPGTTTINEFVVWNNTAGTLAKDGLNTSILHTSNAAVAVSLNPLHWAAYSQLTSLGNVLALSGTISDALGSFRDGFYSSVSDSDTGVYTLSHSNYGARVSSFGPNNGAWQVSTKNLVGLNAYAKGRSSGTLLASGAYPGVAGINADAVQFGEGIGDNEFAAWNPGPADGGLGHSKSLAAVQGIIRPDYADADATHSAYAFLASHPGTKKATAAFGASDDGEYLYFINANTARVTQSAIIMPGSVSGFVGTIINYGAQNGNPAGGSWTDWLGTTNGGQYRWLNSGLFTAQLDTTRLNLAAGMEYAVGGVNGISACTVATAGATITITGGVVTAMTGC